MDVVSVAAGLVALKHVAGSNGASLVAVKQKAEMEQAIAQMVAEAVETIAAANHIVDVAV